MSKNESKQVKVQGKYRPSQSRCSGTSGKEVPWLNLSGIWLAKMGFNIGDVVRIVSRSGLLLIERMDLSAEEAQADYRAALNQVKQTLKKLVK